MTPSQHSAARWLARATATAVAAVALLASTTSAAVALPSGYSYELVSPPQKHGGSTYSSAGFGGGGSVSADGNTVTFASATAFADDLEGSGLALWYRATRGERAWATHGMAPRFKAAATGFGDGAHIGPSSEDMTKVLVCTNVDPVTHEPQVRRNVYLRDNLTGSYTLLTPDPVSGPLTYIANTRLGCGSVVRGYTADLRHVLVGVSGELTADSVGVAGANKLFLVDTDSGAIEFVSIDGDGGGFSVSGISTAAGSKDFHKQNLISADGRFVVVPDGGDLYRRDTVLDESQLVGANLNFREASRDGRYLFVTTPDALVPEDVNGTGDIYRWDADAAPGSEWTLVTADGEPADGAPGGAGRTLWVSPAGDRVYFTAGANQLVAGAPTTVVDHRLYLWDDGTLKYVGSDFFPSTLVSTLDREIHVSPSGNHLAMETGRSNTAFTGDHQIYLYSADESTPEAPSVTCVSCLGGDPSSTPWRGWFEPINLGYQEVGLGGLNWRPSSTSLTMRSRVTDGGDVLFGTASPLLPEDLNGPGRDSVPPQATPPTPAISLQDVDTYLYRDGELHLISSGRDSDNSYPYGISEDGRTIAFTTRESLSGWDFDSAYDVYVAREGAGLPEPPPAPPECDADECQGEPASAPRGSSVATGSPAGRGDVTAAPRPAFSVRGVAGRVRQRLAAGRAARITVVVSRPGRVAVVGRASIRGRKRVILRSTKRATKAGRIAIRVRLSKRARAHLADGRRLRVRLAVRVAGNPRPKTLALKLRRAR